jgi:hypothetical protein
MRTKEIKGNSVVKPLSSPASQDYGDQIPNGMSQQTIDDSTVDTELTINVGNHVEKEKKNHATSRLGGAQCTNRRHCRDPHEKKGRMEF